MAKTIEIKIGTSKFRLVADDGGCADCAICGFCNDLVSKKPLCELLVETGEMQDQFPHNKMFFIEK